MKIVGIPRTCRCIKCDSNIHYIDIPGNKLFSAPLFCDTCALDIYKKIVGGDDIESITERDFDRSHSL